jgi:hypothetical protein
MTPEHVGPRRYPAWLDHAAQLVMFALGVLCILYPILHRGPHAVAYLVTGLVLLGIVRLGDLVSPFTRNRKDRP